MVTFLAPRRRLALMHSPWWIANFRCSTDGIGAEMITPVGSQVRLKVNDLRPGALLFTVGYDSVFAYFSAQFKQVRR